METEIKYVSRELCDERYKNIYNNIEVLYHKQDALNACLTKKFNQIIFGIITTLLSVIASLVVTLFKQ